MSKLSLLSCALILSLRSAVALLPDGRPNANFMRPPGIPLIQTALKEGPVVSRNGTELPPYNTTYYFDQLIDHNNPSLGTFKQRFWHTYEYYQPGGPVVLINPGETSGDGYYKFMTNAAIFGRIAEQQNGTVVVLEHRFYGLSNPYPELTTKNLRVHTIQQAIDDFVYFAKTVNLPMPGGDQIPPDRAPWILGGGSYSGALVSWTMVNKPGVFFAGYASSAVVQAIFNFWEYFEPIRLHMAQNCSADIQAVVQHVDKVFTGKDQAAIDGIKSTFGLSNLTHLDDFAGALRNNLWDWQAIQVTSGQDALFYKFCDALEVKNGQTASAQGWGLDHALAAWGSYFKNTYFSLLCGTKDAEACLGTYNPTDPFYTDTSIDNSARSWTWMICNEVGFMQPAAPSGRPSLVSRIVQPSYDLRLCSLMFPDVFPQPVQPVNVEHTNEVYGGWNVKVDRLFFANGKRDSWKDATVSATRHTVPSTTRQPIALSNGFHCSDIRTANGVADATVGAVQLQALAAMREWLKEWKPNPNYKPRVTNVPPASVAPLDKWTSRTKHENVKPVNVMFKDAGKFKLSI